MSAPLTIFDPNAVYWVWHPQGPSINGTFYGRRFINGVMLGIASGEEAERFQAAGLCCSAWNPGDVLDEWERQGSRSWMAKFAPPESIVIERVVEKVVEKEVPVEVIREVPGQPRMTGGLPDLSAVKELPERLPRPYVELFARYTAMGKLRKK